MKEQKTVIRGFVILCLGFIISACTNTSSAGTASQPQQQGTYAKLNDAYNRKNGTAGRNVVLDTLIATTFYNHPNLIPSIGKSRTHSKTKTSTDTVSNTQTLTNNDGFTSSSIATTSTKTKTKSTTKSVTRGVNVTPNLDYYLK